MDKYLTSVVSVRQNFASLFERTPHSIKPLDGMRAFAVLMCVFFHKIAYWVKLDTQFFAACAQQTHNPLTKMLYHGDLGVDMLFTLSGFLIANSIFRECQKTNSSEIDYNAFVWKRFARLYLPLFVYLVFFDITKFLWPLTEYLLNFTMF